VVVEGYDDVEFYNVSDREIDVSEVKPLHTTAHLTVEGYDDTHRPTVIPTKLKLNDYEFRDVWERYNT
jgi:hypothetical protein